MTTAESRERIEGYERFFGFHEPPFSLAPNPRFLFESASHATALAQVAYAIERREPLVVVTGEIGTGKTLLCRTVLQRIERKTFISIINDPMLERDDLLKQILEDFGVISKDRTRLGPASRHDLIQALQEFLASLAPLQAHAVLIVDEAQHLRPDVLEQIRLLSNIVDDRGTLLQIILVGQPDLDELLARPELRQFQQRVSRRVRLAPLGEDELRQYVDHRLAVACDGGRGSATGPAIAVRFTPEAIQTLASLSGGVPRVINILCDRALEAAHAAWLRAIDAPLIEETASRLGMHVPGRPIEPAARAEVPRSETSVPAMFGPDRRAPAAGTRRGIILAGSLLLAAAAIWLGVRAMTAPEPEPTAAATAPVTPPAESGAPAATTPPAAVPPAPDSPTAGFQTPASPAPAAETPSPATTVPEATPLPGVPGAPAAEAPAGQRFEIVVASFRTESRASSVAAEVTALAMPVRRRVAEGWQQVLAGPFASRAQADEAQKRLDSAGLTGTQIVPTSR